jgi:deoxyribose-phosphate aldolase
MNIYNTALLSLNLLDLTSLNDDDTAQVVKDLCARAVQPMGHAAAVCVWPRFVKTAVQALEGRGVHVAGVANFPDGSDDIGLALSDCARILDGGGDEVDLVFPYRRWIMGERDICIDMMSTMRQACADQARLKIIIESGELPSDELIRSASIAALDCGADFIKTSTGKVPTNATLEAARIMLEAIRDSGKDAGFKAAGGIKDVAKAGEYIALAKEIMGEGWVNPDHLRFGASGLLNDILAHLDGKDIPSPSEGY